MIKTYTYPAQDSWEELVKRPHINQANLDKAVWSIIENVKKNGDKALAKYGKKFDHVAIENIVVSNNEILEAKKNVPKRLKLAIKTAYNNILLFHQSQLRKEKKIKINKGIVCWRESIAIEKVGFYIPGGTAPLFSSILMLGIPAKLAKCKEMILCTPPNPSGKINPTILYTADLVGIKKIFKVGGAQAIAAMSIGTETIPKVNKIFGPGNQYVTKAKEMVQQLGTAIDMPAGPSEVLVIADKSSKAHFVAADLLSQAEHGQDSQVVLLSDNERVIKTCTNEMKLQLEHLPRKETIKQSLAKSKAILFKDLKECVHFSNYYAPEHLVLATNKANKLAPKITNAGSVFLGNYSIESIGDYASGANHVLPTNGFAKSYSGVSVDSFVKKITFQKLNKSGVECIGQQAETMAEAEGLLAHKNAISIRTKKKNTK